MKESIREIESLKVLLKNSSNQNKKELEKKMKDVQIEIDKLKDEAYVQSEIARNEKKIEKLARSRRELMKKKLRMQSEDDETLPKREALEKSVKIAELKVEKEEKLIEEIDILVEGIQNDTKDPQMLKKVQKLVAKHTSEIKRLEKEEKKLQVQIKKERSRGSCTENEWNKLEARLDEVQAAKLKETAINREMEVLAEKITANADDPEALKEILSDRWKRHGDKLDEAKQNLAEKRQALKEYEKEQKSRAEKRPSKPDFMKNDSSWEVPGEKSESKTRVGKQRPPKRKDLL